MKILTNHQISQPPMAICSAMRKDSSESTLNRYTFSHAAIGTLAGDVEELQRFMALTGYSPDSLRAALDSDEFAHSLLSYFAEREDLLLVLSANAGFEPASLSRWLAKQLHDVGQNFEL